MTGELEWEGFASLAQSGVREALFAAGIDCCAQPQPHPVDCASDRYMPDWPAFADPA